MQIERIRRKKNSNFTIVANFVAKDTRLSMKAKGLWYIIMGLPDDWDFSVRGMVAISKEGKDAIYAAILELEQAGYCTRSEVRQAGKFQGVSYCFSEEALPQLEKPRPENPDTVKSDTENPPQLNNLVNQMPKELIPPSEVLAEEFPLLEKKKRKPSSSKASPPDDRVNHPAIVAIRSVCRRLPDKVLWDTLIKTVGDAPNVSRLELAFQQWRLKGYNPTNYSWVTEWYTGKEGSPCPRKERHLDYSDIIEMQSTQLDKCYSREWYEAGKQTFLDCYPDHRELCLKEIAQYEESAAFKLRQQQFDQPPVPQAIYQGT